MISDEHILVGWSGYQFDGHSSHLPSAREGHRAWLRNIKGQTYAFVEAILLPGESAIRYYITIYINKKVLENKLHNSKINKIDIAAIECMGYKFNMLDVASYHSFQRGGQIDFTTPNYVAKIEEFKLEVENILINHFDCFMMNDKHKLLL